MTAVRNSPPRCGWIGLHSESAGLLIAVGVLLWLLALGLAFTIFGVVSALLGFACIVAGAVSLRS